MKQTLPTAGCFGIKELGQSLPKVFTSNKDSPLGKMAHMTIEVAGTKSDKEHYSPNFFTSNLIILLELALSKYSDKYLSQKNS